MSTRHAESRWRICTVSEVWIEVKQRLYLGQREVAVPGGEPRVGRQLPQLLHEREVELAQQLIADHVIVDALDLQHAVRLHLHELDIDIVNAEALLPA